MIEFTILLDDTPMEFDPASSSPDLQFLMPPTARIGQSRHDRDVVHLAPIPVHCFFNAVTLAHWLAREHNISESDAFGVYAIHDMFKALLYLVPQPDGRRRKWLHQGELFFDPIRDSLASAGIFDDFSTSFEVASRHHDMRWREAVSHERQLVAGTETRRASPEWRWPLVGLTVRLQTTLSNVLAIAYVKRLFIESYVEAIRAEFPGVFARYDAISYQYEFLNPTSLTGDLEADIKVLCCQAPNGPVHRDGRKLILRTSVGAYGEHWKPDQETKVCLPFWLLLTLHEDPVSILFPVPTLHGSDGEPADNPDFVRGVRASFHQRVRALLSSAKPTREKQAKWDACVEKTMVGLDDTFRIVHTTSFDDALKARRVDTVATETCSMCGSLVPASFCCSPIADLGFGAGNYTDWHLGDADRTCVLCGVSHFRTPDTLKTASGMVHQRKVVYFSTSTPSAEEFRISSRPRLPFFAREDCFEPRLEIRSLESLVTLNIVAALYLHNTIQQAVHLYKGEPDLWLESVFSTDPFSFAGQVARAKSKVRMAGFLIQLFRSLNRSVVLLDPLRPMAVEVPLQVLACLWGIEKGRHYELKYKPLMVSNRTGTLPIVREGYHLVDSNTVAALADLERLLSKTNSADEEVNGMRVSALLVDPNEFLGILTERGGFNYETLIERLHELAGAATIQEYLATMQVKLRQHPLALELWASQTRKKKRRGS